MTIAEMLRPVDETDIGKLLSVSYSKISLFKQCHLKYKFKYLDCKFATGSSLAMEIGSILHKCLELKGQALQRKEDVDYESLKCILYDGCDETTAADGKQKVKHIAGVTELKKKYWEEYSTPDNASGSTYDEKINIFLTQVLPSELENSEWTPLYFEHPFNFIYDNGTHAIILHGFIDIVESRLNNGIIEYRVRDYKSSKKVFIDSDLPTSMQFFIYALAIYFEFGVFPVEFQYRFILIDQAQTAMTKGWEKRGFKSLDGLLVKIAESKTSGLYPPTPSPLCYYCEFHSDSPNADQKYKGTCNYHSLWTPDNRSIYPLKSQWSADKVQEAAKTPTETSPNTKRKLTF